MGSLLVIIHPFLQFNSFLGIESICCMLEVVGCVPQVYTVLAKDLNWLRDLMNSLKEEIREQAAALYAVMLNYGTSEKEFDEAIDFLLKQATSKNLESQHGALLGIGNCMERRMMSKEKRDYNRGETLKNAVTTIGN